TTHRDPDIGTLTWTTAAGRTYTTHPKDWLEHQRATHSAADPDLSDASGDPARDPAVKRSSSPPGGRPGSERPHHSRARDEPPPF
ncbi:hypothetical protein ACWEOW_17795, partial [Monashia sp. NPDC004114]